MVVGSTTVEDGSRIQWWTKIMVRELLHWLLNQSLHMYQIAKVLSPRDIIYQIEKVLSPKNITSIRAKHCHEIQDLEEIFKDFESQLEKNGP